MVLFCFIFLWLQYHSWWIHTMYLPISFRVPSLALGQYICPGASEETQKDIGKTDLCPTTTNHNKAWTMYIILGRNCRAVIFFQNFSRMTVWSSHVRVKFEVAFVSSKSDCVPSLSLSSPLNHDLTMNQLITRVKVNHTHISIEIIGSQRSRYIMVLIYMYKQPGVLLHW